MSKKGKSFFVTVITNKRWGSTPYFLSLWIDGEATMQDFDIFLRTIWLECCGHASAFSDPRNNTGVPWNLVEAMTLMQEEKMEEYENLMKESAGEIPMSRKAKDILRKGLILDYEYDFGNSTELTLTVLNEYPVKAGEKIVLLSRNEPLQIMCATCGKAPATQLCPVCICGEAAEYCDRCAPKHAKKCTDFSEYAAMPVVNSPRMGICEYTGGTIDRKRDRVN